MSKITFVEDNAKIILYYTCSNGRLKYYTRIPAKKHKGTTAQINRITDLIENMAIDFKVKNEPLTKSVLKSALDNLLGKVKADKTDMFSTMEGIIEKMRTGEILTPKDKKRYAKGSIKNFTFTVRVLKRFDPKLKISTTTMETYAKFLTWCHAKDFSTNYIGTRIKNWRTLGRLVGGNPIFDTPEFKQIREDTFDIYLDEKELAAIVNLKLPGAYDIVRDWFVVGSYTGLRVSDLLLLSEKNLGKDFITIANEKTDEKVVIPIHDRVKNILKKYKGFPPPIAEATLNRMIKEVAHKAGITDNVLYVVTKGGQRKDYYLKKYQMVSSHTMRRNAITNMRSMEPPVPDNIIMLLTGIKSIRTLQRYDKISPDAAAKMAAGMAFFNKKH